MKIIITETREKHTNPLIAYIQPIINEYGISHYEIECNEEDVLDILATGVNAEDKIIIEYISSDEIHIEIYNDYRE